MTEETAESYTNCNHNCDPDDPETRRLGATHYLDCPIWVALGVVQP